MRGRFPLLEPTPNSPFFIISAIYSPIPAMSTDLNLGTPTPFSSSTILPLECCVHARCFLYFRNISKSLMNQEKAARLLMVWREVQEGALLADTHSYNNNITGISIMLFLAVTIVVVAGGGGR